MAETKWDDALDKETFKGILTSVTRRSQTSTPREGKEEEKPPGEKLDDKIEEMYNRHKKGSAAKRTAEGE